MKTYQYVEPRFGFVTNRDKPETPTGRPVKVFTTRLYFAGWKDKEGEVLDFRALHLTKASPGYMIVLCEGRGGGGFFLCSKCGAGFQKPSEFQRGHKTPYGVACQTRPETLRPAVSLGHEIISDVVKLQFMLPRDAAMDPTWLAFSVAYALVEGTAQVLEVPSVDLNATVAYGGTAGLLPPIILYDTVPGGAGLVARLEDRRTLMACMEAGLKRVTDCKGCGEESSCYSCLRSYRNQFAHQFLRRGPASTYLRSVLAAIG
jgi:hypothetical protein